MELALRNNSFGRIRGICFALYAFAAQVFGRKHSETKSDAADRYLREIMDKHGSRLLRLAYS